MLKRKGSLYRYPGEPVGCIYVVTTSSEQFGEWGPQQWDTGICVAHAVDIDGVDWFGLRFPKDSMTYWMDASMIAREG